MTDDLKPIIDEYPLDYCFILEDVYGKSLMSEGGLVAIDRLFEDIELTGKRILDIGSGLGGLAFHIAQKYQCRVDGLEINQEMVEEAKKRIPSQLNGQITFHLYDDFENLPFEDQTFDIICSKGVLVHVDNKPLLFNEFKRILKDKGQLIINDWLAPDSGKWGPKLQRMCEIEELTLYPTTRKSYRDLLSKLGFSIEKEVDQSKTYAGYNMDLVDYLNKNKEMFISKYDKKSWEENVEGYTLISQSQSEQELHVMEFIATKS